jgi:hypothetical protein
MKEKIIKMLLVGAIIVGYKVLYAPEEMSKGKEKGEIKWVEPSRGWDENGTYLWTALPYNVGIGTNTPTHNLHVAGSVRIDGDFYNQEVAASQNSVQLGNPQILQTVTITTHGPNSAVLLTATASCAADYTGWYSISIHRDGTGTANELCETSLGADAGYDVELNLTWIDNPPEGTHTYYLIFGTNGGTSYWYSYSLQAVEIKR